MADRDSRYVDAAKEFAVHHFYDELGVPYSITTDEGVSLDKPVEVTTNTLYLIATNREDAAVQFQYMMKVTDHVTHLAYLGLQDPTKWWVLADANPQLGYPMDWEAGDLVNLPE